MDYLIPAIELGVIGLILLALFVPVRKKKPPASTSDQTKTEKTQRHD